MGQLRDSSREYRKKKKFRKLAKLNATVSSTRRVNERHPVDNAEDSSSPSVSEDEDNEQEEEHTEQLSRAKRRAGSGRNRSEGGETAKHGRGSQADMYKVCDGSALMAVGNVQRLKSRCTMLSVFRNVIATLRGRPPHAANTRRLGRGHD